MIKTRPIKSSWEADDGTRISIMSRHTLEDGETPDTEITTELYDEWWQELAPPAKLVGAYYKRGLDWSEFETMYKNHLRHEHVAQKLIELMRLAENSNITLLCIEESPEQCHRRILAEECLLLDPSVEVEIH